MSHAIPPVIQCGHEVGFNIQNMHPSTLLIVSNTTSRRGDGILWLAVRNEHEDLKVHLLSAVLCAGMVKPHN